MTIMQSPIYVGGLERSGTSLAYALLGSHSRIAMSRRTNMWTHFFGQYGDLADEANLESCLRMMQSYKRLRKLEPDWERLRREFQEGPAEYGRLFGLMEAQFAERVGKPRWGDKSLDTERYTEPILEAFPDAKILHMMRDPRDRFASSLARWKVRRGGAGVGAAEWVRSAELALVNVSRFPENYLVVQYEQLVTDPITVLESICDFIDEPFEPEMLAMGEAKQFKLEGGNSSYGPRESGEIFSTSVGRYVSVLTPQQIRYIDRVAGELMTEFGYERHSTLQKGALSNAAFWWYRFPLERARSVLWTGREAYLDRKGRPVPAYRRVALAGESK